MRSIRTFLMLFVATLTLSGCSLLEVKLESATTPLTVEQLNNRILTREYAQGFFIKVESAAESLHLQHGADDKVNQSYIYLWKINAAEGVRTSAYQVIPMASLIDTWVFTAQMEQFFTTGHGNDLFSSDTAAQTSIELAQEFDQLARTVLQPDSYQSTQQFVQQFAAEHPFADLSFIRTPAYRKWLSENQNGEGATQSLGTMPEAMADVADRLSVVSDVTPKIMAWKTQLIALNSAASMNKVNETLDGVKSTSDTINQYIQDNPENMRKLASQMVTELQPLMDQIDKQAGVHLAQLSEERSALELMVARERQEVAQILSQERAKFAKDIEHVSQQAIDLTMDKLIQLIKSTIVYFVLFIIAIFFAPLGLGYLLGKRAGTKTSR